MSARAPRRSLVKHARHFSTLLSLCSLRSLTADLKIELYLCFVVPLLATACECVCVSGALLLCFECICAVLLLSEDLIELSGT